MQNFGKSLYVNMVVLPMEELFVFGTEISLIYHFDTKTYRIIDSLGNNLSYTRQIRTKLLCKKCTV